MNERTKKVLPVSTRIRAGPLSQFRGSQCGRQRSIFPEHSKKRNTNIPIKHLTKEKAMKTEMMNRRAGPFSVAMCALVLLVVAVLGIPQMAGADTAANTVITNTVTVDYDDALGTDMPDVSASATVTVNLVAAAPDLSSPSSVDATEGETVTLTYTITSNANGADIYDLAAVSGDTDISVPTFNYPDGSTISLGGTTLAADPVDGSPTITVPYDSDADSDNAATNGITAGDTIFIGGEPYVVAAGGVSEDSGTNITTITLTTNITAAAAAAAAAGDPVGERGTFRVEVTTGNLTSSPAAGTHSIGTTATSQTDGSAATTQTTSTVITVSIASLDVTKEVSTDGGATFAASANADYGVTLTYRITVTNNGSGNATNVEITDPMPAFTTYVGSSAKADTTTGTAYGAAATGLTDTDADGDGYDFSVTASDTATYSIGTISAGNSVLLFFQVTID
jgi:uncharacterized repeat protein (TIGR01451 family)